VGRPPDGAPVARTEDADIERPIDQLPPPDGGSVKQGGQMSASTRTVPAQFGFGRLPSALAMLALVVILAAAVAIVALNGTKAAAPVTSGAKGQPPPAVIDHGWSSATKVAPALPAGTSPYGGFGGPAAPVPALKGPVYIDGGNSHYFGGAPRNVARHAQ
jgi:hypothetical protein